MAIICLFKSFKIWDHIYSFVFILFLCTKILRLFSVILGHEFYSPVSLLFICERCNEVLTMILHFLLSLLYW